MARLWDKGLPLDERILRFTAGEDHLLDERLVEYDARASIAHARMLEKQQLLSAADCQAICDGPRGAAAAHAAGEWSIELADEDVHSALERRLTERIGEAGGRVHLGRSRNDQVLVALRLYLRDAIETLAAETDGVVAALERVATEQGSIALPGYTHMQPAMPSSRRALGARLRRRARRRSRGVAARARARRPESARLRGRLRRAEPAARSRGDARRARLRAHAGARHGRAALARQGRGGARVRDRRCCSATSAGSRPTCSFSTRASSPTWRCRPR